MSERSGGLPLAVRAALATYPPSFRERYGGELGALLEDTGSGQRVVLDLLVGSLRAWLRPVLGADVTDHARRRRLATVSTVWVCWCAVFVATGSLLRVLEDPPPAGFDPNRGGWGAVHDMVATGLAVGWLLVLAAGAPIGMRALRRSAGVRRVVVPPLLLLGFCVLVFVPLQVYATQHWVGQGRSASASDIPLWWALLGLVWLATMGVDVVWGTAALAVGLRRADLGADLLRLPAIAAAVLVLPMTLIVVALVAIALAGAHPSAGGPFEPLVYVTLAGLLVVIAVASVSAVRGVRVRDVTG